MGDLTVSFKNNYRDTILHLVQQVGTRFRDRVIVKTDATGEFDFHTQLGKLTPVQRVVRNADTAAVAVDNFRRRVAPQIWDLPILTDQEDIVLMVTDPTSAYSEGIRNGLMRKIDDLIIDAALGTAFTGKDGTTAVALPAAQKIAAGGTGLTKAKVIQAAKILNSKDVPEDDRWFAIGEEQLEDLQGILEFTSRDYNVVETLVSGRPARWIGFNWVLTTQLDKSGSDRQTIAWHRDGLALSIWHDIVTRIDERADKNYAKQVFASMQMGATRMEEERVVQVDCQE